MPVPPPVFALATLVVLVGGAVVIARRGDSMKSESTIERPGGREDTAAARPAGAPPMPGPAEPTREGAPKTDPWHAGSAAGTTTAPRPDLVKGAGPAASRPEPKLAPKVSREHAAEPRAQRELGSAVGGAEKQDEKLDRITAETATTRTGGLAIASDHGGAPSPAPVQPDGRELAPRPPPMADAGGARAAGTASGEARQVSPVEQLIKQCETAAARGDCAAVRVLAERIAKSSPGVYKDRVVKNAGVARCLK